MPFLEMDYFEKMKSHFLLYWHITYFNY